MRNVHKEDITAVKLPEDAVAEDRGARNCRKPHKVLASTSDVALWKNDRTAIAYKFDTMTVELEAPDGTTIAAPGIAVAFPNQSDAVGYVIDWRQVTDGSGALMQKCWKVKISWTLAGNSGSFYYGSYLLREYSVANAAGTVRLFVVLNDYVRKQGINYKGSGFAGTVRFEGQFGYMQPNYDTENNIHTDRVRNKVRIEAVRTHELRTSYLLHCMTRLIDEETLLAANQIYVTDHNVNNHDQTIYDFPVILSEDESPSFQYDESPYAKLTAIFKEKKALSESKYDGNIQGSDNIILELPTLVGVGAVDVSVNSTPEGTADSSSVNVNLSDSSGTVTPDSVTITGSDVGITLPDSSPAPVGATLMKTGQTTSYRTGDDGDLEAGRATDFLTLGTNNPFGNTNRFTDELGGSTYANKIAIDWSTYDNIAGTVSGYYYGAVTSGVFNWNDCIDNAAAFSVGTFTTGWALPNARQAFSLIHFGKNQSLNYPPFNFNASYAYATSTTQFTNPSTYFMSLDSVRTTISQNFKTSVLFRWWAVRTFTVTGTTLT